MDNMQEQTVPPPENVETLAEVEKLLCADKSKLKLVAQNGESVELPDVLHSILDKVVSAMRRGKAITLAPHAMRLTTQEAADLLGISRPTLIKLLEDGRIPYETPNRHRRIRLLDLLNYQSIRHTERQEVLRDLTNEAQEDGTFDESFEKYESALSKPRQKFA